MNAELKKEMLDYLEAEISRYASLSGLEIDRAKREFEVKTTVELQKMRKMDYLVKTNLYIPPKSLKMKKESKNKALTEEEIKYNDDVQKCIDLVQEIEDLNKKLCEALNNDDISEEEKQSLYDEHYESKNPIKAELSNQVSKLKKTKKDSIIRPYFMKWCGRGKLYKYKLMNCPMDHLEDILDKEFPRKSGTDNKKGDTISLKKIFINPEEDIKKADRTQIKNIVNIVTELDKRIRGNIANNKKQKSEDCISDSELFEDAVELIATMTIKPITIKAIFYRIYGNPKCNTEESKKSVTDIRYIKTRLIDVLYAAHPEEVLAIFDYDTDYKKLDVFGQTYLKNVNFIRSRV
jgi:hypothetical protein